MRPSTCPLFLALLLSALAALDSGTSAQVVSGVLLQTVDGRPVAGAEVLLLRTWDDDPVAVTVTDTAGHFRFALSGRGRFLLAVEHLGRRTSVDHPLTLLRSDPVDVRIDLPVEAIELAPISVEASAREPRLDRMGFYRRQLGGMGRFLGPAEFERRRPTRLTDMLQAMNGVRLVPRRYGGGLVVVMRGTLSFRRAECTPRVLLDWKEVTGGAEELDAVIDPALVAGMEVYTRSIAVPAEFGTSNAAFGVIAIWTGARPPPS